MEYKKEKRTKNLTLRDIHVGDWVQEWNPTAERYSPPMKVSCINYDGTVYLVPDDENYCTPYETEIENVDALPITPKLLKGFELEVKHIDGLGRMLFHKNNITDFTGDVVLKRYIHELIDEFEMYPSPIKIEWKGVQS